MLRLLGSEVFTVFYAGALFRGYIELIQKMSLILIESQSIELIPDHALEQPKPCQTMININPIVQL